MLVFSYQFKMSMDCLIFKTCIYIVEMPFLYCYIYEMSLFKCHLYVYLIYKHLSLNCHIYELTYQYSEDDFLP